MQVGVVTPIKYMNLFPTDFLVCYSCFLTDKSYLNYCKSYEGVIILDYSPRLPRGINLEVLGYSIDIIKPTMVVLPSIDYSSKKTILVVKDFLIRRKTRKVKQELVGVIQGYDLDSLRESYLFLKDLCSVIGLPSPLESIARRDEIIRDLSIKEKVLYLEVWSNPYEEIPLTNSMGIFTSFPIRLASDYRRLNEFRPTPSPLNFQKGDLVEDLAKMNVEEYKEVVKYARI